MDPRLEPTTRTGLGPGADADPPPALAGGEELIPGYRLTVRLGVGGFGEVWRAVGPGGVPVALKAVRLDAHGAALEAHALGFMKFVTHPHLLTTFGIWTHGGYLVIGMELAERSLWDRLREAVHNQLPGVPARELLGYMAEAAKGIDFLNEARHTVADRPAQGIVHRDIKPQNLLLVGGGVKVADFGLARVMERTAVATSAGMTPAYAAPEFFHRQAAPSSDQYSLAVAYCQLRANRLPFDGTPMEMMAGHLSRPPDLSVVPEAERDVVARALAKDPADRWPSCRAFVGELADRQTASRPSRVVAVPDRFGPVTNSVGMRLVYVPAGHLLMGSPDDEPDRHPDEGPQRLVTITRGFYVGVGPVTSGSTRR